MNTLLILKKMNFAGLASSMPINVSYSTFETGDCNNLQHERLWCHQVILRSFICTKVLLLKFIISNLFLMHWFCRTMLKLDTQNSYSKSYFLLCYVTLCVPFFYNTKKWLWKAVKVIVCGFIDWRNLSHIYFAFLLLYF